MFEGMLSEEVKAEIHQAVSNVAQKSLLGNHWGECVGSYGNNV